MFLVLHFTLVKMEMWLIEQTIFSISPLLNRSPTRLFSICRQYSSSKGQPLIPLFQVVLLLFISGKRLVLESSLLQPIWQQMASFRL